MNLKKILKKLKTDKRIKIIKKFIGKKVKILEIGVHEGTFSNLLLKEFNPKIFYLVDPWKYQSEELYKKSFYGGNLSNFDGQKKLNDRYEAVKLNFKEQIFSGEIILVRKNSNEIFDLLKDNFFDLIYIDGNHTLDFVKSDIINALNKIKKDGIVVCDDYGNPGWWDDGVTKAVDKLCEENYVKKIFTKSHQCVLKKVI
jgi:hypothetical protein